MQPIPGMRPASPPWDGTVSMATVSVQGEACAAPIRTQLANISRGAPITDQKSRSTPEPTMARELQLQQKVLASLGALTLERRLQPTPTSPVASGARRASNERLKNLVLRRCRNEGLMSHASPVGPIINRGGPQSPSRRALSKFRYHPPYRGELGRLLACVSHQVRARRRTSLWCACLATTTSPEYTVYLCSSPSAGA